MGLDAGQQLLHYRLIDQVGEGGMGVVWRAQDTTLDRDVAIKVLPDLFTRDPERLARFDREAKLLASLNHPNIATLYGLQQDGEARFLVMELVEGDDLSQRLQRGPLPMEEALPIASQLAEALESAHERGVIHRDLKPANVKVNPEGQVKVLDFGLAKALDPAGEQSDPALSPTLTSMGTQVGVILGTAAYMSPEQAKGKAVDRRADIWAFGVILYELLTGQRLFKGDSASETLAAVLMLEPDLEQLPANTPPRVRRLIERCLRRDPVSRLRDIGDARIVLEEAVTGREWSLPAADLSASDSAGKRRMTLAQAALWCAAGLLVGAAAVWSWSGPGASSMQETLSLAIPIPPTLRLTDHPPPRLTPDGRTVVFRAVDVDPDAADNEARIYVRPLGRDELTVVQGSKSAGGFALSPDGEWLVYVSPIAEGAERRQLMRVPLDQSAPPQKIVDWPSRVESNFFWAEPDRILLFRGADAAMLPVSVSDGTVGAPVQPQPGVGAVEFEVTGSIGDGRHLLVQAASFEKGQYQQNTLLLDTESGTMKRLASDASHPVFSPSGHLLFTRDDTLLAAPFDRNRLEIVGGARTVASGIWSSGAYTGGYVDVSPDGHLVYGGGSVQGPRRNLVLVGRDGVTTPWTDEQQEYNVVTVSPDGRRVCVQVDNASKGDTVLQIKVSDFERPQFVTLATASGRDCATATWSTDSGVLAYYCQGADHREVYVTNRRLEAQAEPVFSVEAPSRLRLAGFLPGDSHLLVQVYKSGLDELVSVPLGSARGSGTTLPVEEGDLANCSLTPDGRWLLYSTSPGGGRQQFFVRRVESPTSLGPRLPALVDADRAFWGKKTKGGVYELLFERASQLHSVEFVAAATPRFSEAVAHDVEFYRQGLIGWEALPDGRLLAIRAPDTERGASELRLVLNWTRELSRRFD